MESFTEILERSGSATAQMLMLKYQDAMQRKKQAQKDAEDVMREIIEKVCPYKIGQVFRDVYQPSQTFVLAKIHVNEYALSGDCTYAEPWIDFNYSYRAICKDGHLSPRFSYLQEGQLEPTGEVLSYEEC